MKHKNNRSTVYWEKLAKVQRFVDIKKIPQQELTEIEKLKVTNPRKVEMLNELCEKYNLKLV